MTDAKSRPGLPPVPVRSMAERLRRPSSDERPWTRGPRPGGQRTAALADAPKPEEEPAMTPAAIRCVVGIAVAKQAHVVGALEAPNGVLRHKPSQIEAPRQGYALWLAWLATWRASAQPEAVRIGLE